MPIYRFLESGRYHHFCEVEASDVEEAFRLLDGGEVEEVKGFPKLYESKVTLHEIKFREGEYEALQKKAKEATCQSQ